MDGVVGVVKPYGFAVEFEREVVFVDFSRISVVEVDVPVESFDVDDKDVVAFLVEKRVESLRRAQGNVVFRRIATAYDGYVPFSCLHCFLSSFGSAFRNLLLLLFESVLCCAVDIVAPFVDDSLHVSRQRRGEVHLLSGRGMSES